MLSSPISLLDQIGQLELRVGDIDIAHSFYGETLGMPVESIFGQTLLLRCGELRIFVQQSTVRPIGCPIYFRVDGRVHEVADALRSRGIRFKSGPSCIVEEFQGHSSWLAFFEDPWGNPLALMGDMPVGAPS